MFISTSTDSVSIGTAQDIQADIQPYTKGDTSNFPVHPHSTVGEPAKGEGVFDSNYGTTVIKAADANEFPSSESGGVVRPVYSRWRIDNSAGDLYYLVKGEETPPGSGKGQMVIFRSSDDSVYKIATEVDGLEVHDFRWDYSGTKPHTLYYVDGTQFREYNVDTGEISLIRDFVEDFPNAERILNDAEGDSSADSRYWAWMVQGQYTGTDFPMLAVITYDKQTNTILGTLDYARYKALGGADSSLPRPNMVDVSPLGSKVVALWGRTDKQDVFDGPHAYDFDFLNPVKVSNDETHSGWAFDQNGDEVYVSQINNDNWDAVDADTIAYVNIRTGEVHAILYFEDMGWDMGGVHFGRFYDRSIRGWVYVTTYSETNSKSPLGNTAFMLEIKPYNEHPRIWRIADTHNDYSSEDPLAYEKEAYSPISGDGTTIYWAADWRGGDGTVDTYKIRLPNQWWVDLRSGNSLAIPEFPSEKSGDAIGALCVILIIVVLTAAASLSIKQKKRNRVSTDHS
jgi:hypothetical protein